MIDLIATDFDHVAPFLQNSDSQPRRAVNKLKGTAIILCIKSPNHQDLLINVLNLLNLASSVIGPNTTQAN